MWSVVCACWALVCATERFKSATVVIKARNKSSVGTRAARCKVWLCIGLCKEVCMETPSPSSMESDIACPQKPPNGSRKTKECRKENWLLEYHKCCAASLHRGHHKYIRVRQNASQDASRKLQLTYGLDQLYAFFNTRSTHKNCQFTNRHNPRWKKLDLIENRANFQRLSAKSQDQNFVRYQILYPKTPPTRGNAQSDLSWWGIMGNAFSLAYSGRFVCFSLSPFLLRARTHAITRVTHAA